MDKIPYLAPAVWTLQFSGEPLLADSLTELTTGEGFDLPLFYDGF